jgi:hypothetical protein
MPTPDKRKAKETTKPKPCIKPFQRLDFSGYLGLLD